MNRAVFLDRDNTLIRNDGDLGDPGAVAFIDGASRAIADFSRRGFKIVVVTNQGGVARGRFTCDDVERVHQRINDLLRADQGVTIDRFYYCPYHPDGTEKKFKSEHPWRKPNPGMLLQAGEDLELDLAECWMIGDQIRDIRAGLAAGVKTILFKPDPDKTSDKTTAEDTEAHYVIEDLLEAVEIVTGRPDSGSDRLRSSKETDTDKTGESPSPDHAQSPEDAGSSRVGGGKNSDPNAGVTGISEPKLDADRGDNNKRIPAEQTLREILQELRNQRSSDSDFSYTTALGVVLQTVAAVCLLGALMLGGEDAMVFFRWIGVGIMLELATLAVLMFGK